MTTTTVSAPGKCLLAGGYVVLESPQPALVLCTGSRFYSSVSWGGTAAPSHTVTVASAQLGLEWRYALRQSGGERKKSAPLQVEPLGEARNPFVENALRVVAARRYCTERLKPVFTSQHKAELACKNPDLACSGVCAPQPRSCGPAVSCSHCPVCSPGIALRDTEKPSAHGRRGNGIVHTATQATLPRVDPDSEHAGSVVIEYRAERHASTCVVIDQRADHHASTRVLL